MLSRELPAKLAGRSLARFWQPANASVPSCATPAKAAHGLKRAARLHLRKWKMRRPCSLRSRKSTAFSYCHLPNSIRHRVSPRPAPVITAVKTALEAARPRKVICLSTIGAQAMQPNLLTQRTLMEQQLRELAIPVSFLRPAWFMENFAWDVASARDAGVITSFLQPLDKPFPMIATADVGRVAAELIQEDCNGCRVVELEAAHRITPNEVAATFAKILDHPVRVAAVPRETWGSLFKSQGMKNPTPRIQMLDGFNEGWIEFERGESGSMKGKVTLEMVLRGLIEAGA
jgi:NAD(P)H dehydrogenase (quinone)